VGKGCAEDSVLEVVLGMIRVKHWCTGLWLKIGQKKVGRGFTLFCK
jgi:hypothetical protein